MGCSGIVHHGTAIVIADVECFARTGGKHADAANSALAYGLPVGRHGQDAARYGFRAVRNENEPKVLRADRKRGRSLYDELSGLRAGPRGGSDRGAKLGTEAGWASVGKSV